MRVGAVLASEVAATESRLSGGFHLAEDQLAIRALGRIAKRSVSLSSIVGGRGVFRGPIFRRVYAETPDLGAPYVSAKDLEAADIRSERYLAHSLGSLLSDLTLRDGMILVTCSGMNLGRAIWTRPDMDGLCASHDLIRIEVDHAQAPPGYVYAFLVGRFGRAAIRKQIYGGSIRHVEPFHLERVGIPRLDASLEVSVDSTVRSVAVLRSNGVKALRSAAASIDQYLNATGGPSLSAGPHQTTILASQFLSRGDGDHYSRSALWAERVLARCSARPLGELCEVSLPPISSRVQTEDPLGGFPYFSGHALYMWRPEQKGFLARRSPKVQTMIMQDECILMQAFGQREGLIGRAAWATEDLVGAAVSGLMLRMSSKSRRQLALVFAYLHSRVGEACVGRLPYGGSIPHMNEDQLRALPIPTLSKGLEDEVVAAVECFALARHEGATRERAAIALVERAIEEAE